MKNMRLLIRTTLIGGVLFLIPLVFVVAIFGKAVQIMTSLAVPLGKLIPIDSVAGIAVVPILATLIMFFACLIAGLLARSPAGQKVYTKLDAVLLQMIPGYAWVKGVTGGISDEDAEEVLKPVLIRFDDQFQLGYEVERKTDGLVAVYLPSSPDPRSGTVSFVEDDRVQSIDVSFTAISKICKNLGRGSITMLSGQKA